MPGGEAQLNSQSGDRATVDVCPEVGKVIKVENVKGEKDQPKEKPLKSLLVYLSQIDDSSQKAKSEQTEKMLLRMSVSHLILYIRIKERDIKRATRNPLVVD